MPGENNGETSTKVAIITGASRGLGRNTALNLAKRGVDLIITYHANRAEADAAVTAIQALGRKAVAFRLDSGDTGTFAGFVTDVGRALHEIWGRDRFDYLINNAGTGLSSPFAETTEADFDRLVNLHFKGVFFLTQKLLPLIEDGGRIVNISTGLMSTAVPKRCACLRTPQEVP
jgi:NAD(P)-dependent dehydrogenase (short-subunit alcohol dehydrogenase family)